MCPHGPSDGEGLGAGSVGDGRVDAAVCCEIAASSEGLLWPRENQK